MQAKARCNSRVPTANPIHFNHTAMSWIASLRDAVGEGISEFTASALKEAQETVKDSLQEVHDGGKVGAITPPPGPEHRQGGCHQRQRRQPPHVRACIHVFLSTSHATVRPLSPPPNRTPTAKTPSSMRTSARAGATRATASRAAARRLHAPLQPRPTVDGCARVSRCAYVDTTTSTHQPRSAWSPPCAAPHRQSNAAASGATATCSAGPVSAPPPGPPRARHQRTHQPAAARAIAAKYDAAAVGSRGRPPP